MPNVYRIKKYRDKGDRSYAVFYSKDVDGMAGPVEEDAATPIRQRLSRSQAFDLHQSLEHLNRFPQKTLQITEEIG